MMVRGNGLNAGGRARAGGAGGLPPSPPQTEEAFDEDEPFDIEVESEVETEETEGLTDESPVSAGSGGETEADGHKRNRGRRRRRRPREPREGGTARDRNQFPPVVSDTAARGPVGGNESAPDEAEWPPRV